MRMPWIATLDALIEELNKHLPTPVAKSASKPDRGPISVIEVALEGAQLPASQSSTDGDLRRAIETLSAAREILVRASDWELAPDDLPPRQISMRNQSLATIDKREVRFPDKEGREGLALFIEQGGLIGPIMGAHIANVIRGTHKFKTGPQYDFEQGRWRRFVVKRVATIQHLYSVGLRKAVVQFSQHFGDDDPDEKAPDRFEKWVKDDRKIARRMLADPDLPAVDHRHYQSILDGLCGHIPKGALKGKEFPQGFEEALRSRL